MPADDPQERAALGAAYKAEVGYDPFEDDPTITVAEVRQTLAEVRAEAAKHPAP